LRFRDPFERAKLLQVALQNIRCGFGWIVPVMFRVVRAFTFLSLVIVEDGGRARMALEYSNCI
jgi:hypothetical protein